MAWDIGLLLTALVLIGAGYRLGLRASFAATLALVAIVAVALRARGMPDNPPVLLLAIGAWGLGVVALGWLRRRGRPASFAGGTLGLVQAAAIAVLGAGALGAADAGLGLRDARAYAPVALAGARVEAALPDVRLAYPAPEPEATVPAPEVPPRPIAWAEAVPFDEDAIRILTGTVRAAERAPLAFEVEGRVREIAVAIGDAFEAGDVLATLDATTLEIALDERRAALMEAEAVLTEARQDHERQSELFERGVVSTAARDAARATLDATRGRVAAARAAVASAEDRLDEAELVAPYDGRVAARLMEPAQLVRAGEPAFEIQSFAGGFEIDVTVPETLIAALERGSEHEALLLDGRGTAVDATLTEIGSRAERATGFPVTLAIDDTPDAVRAGMTAEIRLRVGAGHHDGALAIPLTALAPGDGTARRVFVHDPATGTVAPHAVRLAGVEGETAVISDGLAPGDVVATAGLPFLRDGMPVALLGTGVARYDQ